MRVLIWVPIQDVVNNKITDIKTDGSKDDRFVQVSISQDEFVRLIDGKSVDEVGSENWILDQYNRNRAPEDQVHSYHMLQEILKDKSNEI